MASYATWETGEITVPSSTGAMVVSGLRQVPDAVLFFGTNFLTEDVAQVGNGYGFFRGMAGPQYNSLGTLLQNAACILETPGGNAHEMANSAIVMLDTAGAAARLYAADVTALTTGGFTLNWTTAAAGGYKVFWVALSGVNNLGAYIGGSATVTMGWRAGAALMHGAWAGPAITGNDRTQEFYGGGSYPGSSLNWTSAGLTAFTFPTSAFGQFNIGIYNIGPFIEVAQDGSFAGPFLQTQNIQMGPTGGGLLDFVMNLNDATNAAMWLAWDDQDAQCGRSTPATASGNSVTVSGLPFKPGLVLYYVISNQPQVQGTGGIGAAGFGVLHEDLQWTVVCDGPSTSAFQSRQRCTADVVNGANVHACSGAITDDGFTLTTHQDAVAPASVVWHAFGHPLRGAWVPQYYREIPTKGKVGA